MTSQITSAITSIFTTIRSGWLRRLTGATALMLAVMLMAIGVGTSTLPAQQPQAPQISDTSLAPGGGFLLTIFLKHDEPKTLDQINAQLKAQGFYKAFPPDGTQVVSWYVMMGIGQVVTLRVPAERLRDVNRAIEQTAWGGYRTEFYATYDYKSVGEEAHAKALAQ
jgi:hypothetical protein